MGPLFRRGGLFLRSPSYSVAEHDGAEVLFAEAVEGVARHAVFAADGRYAVSSVQHADDLAAVVDELLEFGVAAFAASQNDALFAPQGQRFARAHGNKVAFDLGHEAEGEAEHLAVDRVVENAVVFGAV